jgi:hypothetical protein
VAQATNELHAPGERRVRGVSLQQSKKWNMTLRALLFLFASGCIQSSAVEDQREAVRDHGNELIGMQATLVQMCSAAAVPTECDELMRRYIALQRSYTRINEATQ